MTRLPDTFGHYIGVYKDARSSAASYDFEDSGGGYLFEGRDGRPFSVSSWTTVVKDTWKRHCGLSPPPKLLRAIFICWLRDQAHTNKATPEVLKSCATLMKHQLATQESDVYDKKTHERLTKSAFDFTSDFADRCAQARLRGEPMPSSSGGAATSSSSSTRPSAGSGGGARAPRGGGRGGRGAHAGRSGRGRGRGRGRGHPDKGPTQPPTPPLSSSPDVEDLVGTTVRRSFDGTWFDGDISFVNPYYRVTYSDGDISDLTALELRFLADLVFPEATISFHSGDLDGGWSDGTVVEPYHKKHGALWVPKGYEWQSSATHSWLVQFRDGVAAVALPTERKVEERADNPPGSWMSLSN
mmetsp:Transcript_25368/g.59009  ORF Transcript_25368/g.59009 Transcript_25368/m.59009 type:complete len:355 (+) Transcript_25368:661-1725(+)